MRTYLSGGNILTPRQMLYNHTLVLEDGIIAAIEPGQRAAGSGGKVYDLQGRWIVPGFIDVHVHGAMGHDMMESTPEVIHILDRYYARYGVTSYLPTTWSSQQDELFRAIENVAKTPQVEDGAQHIGVHVEGPYLAVEHRGAQPAEVLRLPDPKEYESWLQTGVVKLVTVAPEVEGALEFIEWASRRGIQIAIGHSGASYEQVLEAAGHGARQATHTFNGMLGLHHRHPGTLGGVLTDDRIYAQMITDGIHLHPAMVKMLVRAKTPARTLLITDAVCGTGLEDGVYTLFGGLKITVKSGIARTDNGALAGSTLTMDAAVRNTLEFTGAGLQDVVQMATSVPAEVMNLTDRKGSLAVGLDADVAVLGSDLRVCMTIVGGRVVYQA